MKVGDKVEKIGGSGSGEYGIIDSIETDGKIKVNPLNTSLKWNTQAASNFRKASDEKRKENGKVIGAAFGGALMGMALGPVGLVAGIAAGTVLGKVIIDKKTPQEKPPPLPMPVVKVLFKVGEKVQKKDGSGTGIVESICEDGKMKVIPLNKDLKWSRQTASNFESYSSKAPKNEKKGKKESEKMKETHEISESERKKVKVKTNVQPALPPPPVSIRNTTTKFKVGDMVERVSGGTGEGEIGVVQSITDDGKVKVIPQNSSIKWNLQPASNFRLINKNQANAILKKPASEQVKDLTSAMSKLAVDKKNQQGLTYLHCFSSILYLHIVFSYDHMIFG